MCSLISPLNNVIVFAPVVMTHPGHCDSEVDRQISDGTGQQYFYQAPCQQVGSTTVCESDNWEQLQRQHDQKGEEGAGWSSSLLSGK